MSRGGMCKNPFSGFTRLDKLEPQRFLRPNDPPEKAILMATLLDACHNYIFFGLGDADGDGNPRGNGTMAENFFFDHRYLFVVRSYLPETWRHARYMKDIYTDEKTGIRRTVRKRLSDTQLMRMTFDWHFGLMDFPVSIETFLMWVRERREEVLTKDWSQIQNYVRLLRQHSLAEYAEGHTLPMLMDVGDEDRRILTDPRSPEEVEAVVGYLPRCFVELKHRTPRAARVRPAVVLNASTTLTCAKPNGWRPHTAVFNFESAIA